MILDGKKIKSLILDELRDEVIKLSIKPKLVVIQINNDDASNVYIKQKVNMCNYVGYEFEHIKLENANNEDILKLIDKLNNDKSVTGIMIQLPLPNNIDKNKVLNSICHLKDIDGLTDINRNKLINGENGLFPCTPLGIMELLDRYKISVNGKCVVIVGRSDLVGKPLGLMIENNGGKVMFCHSKTKDISKYTKCADILISAVGRVKLITVDMVKDGAIVVDVGISKVCDSVCGDVDFNLLKEKCSYITPVPGGVGPMTIAMLSKNIIKAYKLQ